MKRSNLSLALLSLLIDLGAIFFGFYLAYYIRAAGGDYLYFWPIDTYLTYVVLSLPLFLIFLASQGLYNPRKLPNGWQSLGKLVIGIVSAWGVILIGLYLWRSPEAQVLPRLLIIYSFGLATIFAVIGRVVSSFIVSFAYRRGFGVTRTAVISASGDNQFLARLKSERDSGRVVVRTIEIGRFDREIDKIKDNLDELIVASEGLPEEKILKILAWAENNYKQFAIIPTLFSVRAANVEVVTVASAPVAYFLRTPLEGWKRIIKRALDLILALLTLILLSPIFALVYLIIKLTSPGPAIYKQERIGQDGRSFYIHKFRSMYLDADSRFPNYNGWSGDEQSDPRITPFGRFLRRTNIDELPQFWDILIGQMSIVGPRPEQPSYVKKFARDLPDYLKRHYVKTGLTGWAQINGLRGDTSIEERIKYDIYYIENWSAIFDLRIIVVTGLLFLKQLFRGN